MQIRFKYISTRTGKSLILNVENKRYVFNLFEGFQRYAIEQNISLKGIDAVFLPDYNGISAFLGFYLTIRDMQKKFLSVVCNDDVSKIIERAEIICPRKELQMHYMKSYEDEYIKVITATDKSQKIQNYVLEFADIPGKLLINKIPAGIPKRFYSSLKDGKDIEFNGKKYKGADYIEKPIKIGRMLLIFGDSINIESFTKDEFEIVFCFDEKAYRTVNKHFKRVYLMNLNNQIEFISQHAIQKNLNMLDPNFLMPSRVSGNITYGHLAAMRTYYKRVQINCGNEKRKKRENKCHKSFLLNLKNAIIQRFHSRYINSGDDIIYTSSRKTFKIHSNKAKKYPLVRNESINNSLTFLGTGCALPSKYRNVSSVLYNINDILVLFDCGEDTLSQLNRIYGHTEIINKIRYIFISHSHADHCLGVINLLKITKQNVTVIAPSALIEFLSIYNFRNIKYYNTTLVKPLEIQFYEDNNISQNSFSLSKLEKLTSRVDLETIYEEVITNYVLDIEVDDFTFYVCGVDHTSDSCSVSMVYRNQIKISYSGDTRPSPIFAIMSMKSDALIHESTFNSSNLDKAIKTRHSTVQEANAVFKFSKSQTLFLTHFSQRYPKGFITIYKGIPCMDFYRYVLDVSTFDKNKINNYLKTLEY